jgi:hexosaminidase
MRRDVQSGLQPAQSAFEVRAGVSPAGDHGQVRLALAAEAGPETIRYTTDGSAPTADGARYLAPFALPLPARLRARTFSRAGLALGAETDETIDAASLRRRDSHALALCTRTLALNLEDDAPVGSRTRPVILTDILNPCWMWPQADLAGVKGFAVEVAALPFNFALGEAPPPASAAGGEARLEIRLGGCGGPALAVLPLRRGPGPPGLTRLTAGIDPAVAPADGAPHDLCFQVVRPTLNPLWVVNAVELEGRDP